MARRSSSLSNVAGSAISREIDSKYDVIKEVQENLELLESLGSMDFDALIAELQSAQDFTGITVVSGEVASWDAETKVLTVPTVQGVKGEDGSVGGTPIFEFSYNEATGNLEYEIIDYGFDQDPVGEW